MPDSLFSFQPSVNSWQSKREMTTADAPYVSNGRLRLLLALTLAVAGSDSPSPRADHSPAVDMAVEHETVSFDCKGCAACRSLNRPRDYSRCSDSLLRSTCSHLAESRCGVSFLSNRRLAVPPRPGRVETSRPRTTAAACTGAGDLCG